MVMMLIRFECLENSLFLLLCILYVPPHSKVPAPFYPEFLSSPMWPVVTCAYASGFMATTAASMKKYSSTVQSASYFSKQENIDAFVEASHWVRKSLSHWFIRSLSHEVIGWRGNYFLLYTE